MLEKFDRFNRRISSAFERIGFASIILMVVLTCVDVIGAKLFLTPIYGALDVMMLAQLIAISSASSMALIQGRHVKVEFFIRLLPSRVQALIDCIVDFLCLSLFVLIVWQLYLYGNSIAEWGEGTMTARIPLSPFSYAAAAAFFPVSLVFLQRFLHSIFRVMGK